jgi:molybdopterin-dependent oxidoreductase alpha subunit
MCHESSGSALTATLGIGKGSTTLNDLEKAEVIIIIGQNPATNAPRMLTSLERAKRNGAKIVAINPLIEAGLLAFKNPQDVRDILTGATTLTDIYLQVNLNQDLALIKCIIKLLVEADTLSNGQVFDYSFINADTEGFMQLIDNLNDYSVDKLAIQSGVELSKIKQVTDLLAVHNKIVICWAMGMTQHKNSVVSIQEVVNLLLLKGSIGREGAGTFPVRGHSNVQGNRTVGIFEKPSQKLLDSIEKVFGFKPPQEHGFGTVEAIKAMHENKGKVFFGLGGNFLSATPDTDYTSRAMTNCDLTVHVSTKLNRSHLVHGKVGIILPTLGRTDEDIQASGQQFVTVENSIGFVHNSKGILSPPSDTLLSEPAIVAEMAKATLDTDKYQVNWDNLIGDYNEIRDLIEQTVEGFDNYNARVVNEEGFFLPNAPREGKFTTESKKAQFTINAPTQHFLKENEYLMMTIRSHDQFNTTIYGLNDRYRGIYNERRVIMMNEKDIKTANLTHYQVVNLHNYHGGTHREVQRFIVVPYNIPVKNVATYFPEANPLVPIDSIADKSNTPTSKSVVIMIEPVLENGKIVIAEVRG